MIRSFRSCVDRQLFFGPTRDESKASELWKPMIQNGRGVFYVFHLSKEKGMVGWYVYFVNFTYNWFKNK